MVLIVIIEDKDGNITKMEILEIREKMGNFRKAVPVLILPLAILFCIINTLTPGIGSILGALSLLCCGKSRHPKSKGIKYGILAGIIQLLTAPLIIGWIWSILYGVNMIQDSVTKDSIQSEEEEEDKGQSKSGNKTQAWA